jgi:hypothetical protein
LKPVDQIIFPDLPNGIRGDCFRACVASIFELPSEEVPHFVQAGNTKWWPDLQDWLRTRGLCAICIKVTPDEMQFGWPNEETFCIVNGRSPRGNGLKHSVVGKLAPWNFEIVFDPHPSRAGLDGPIEDAFMFLPLIPAPAPQ